MEGTNLKLDLDKFLTLKKECLVLDCRVPAEVKKGFIPGSICIPIATSQSYTSWIKDLIEKDTKLLLICDLGTETEAVTKLKELSYSVEGYLEGGVQTWINGSQSIQEYNSITAADLAKKMGEKLNILDVRDKSSWDTGVLNGAQLIGIQSLNSKIDEIPKDKPVFVHCTGGGRSLTAYTALKSKGLNVIDIEGGIKGVMGQGVEVKKPPCL